jgi:hypothetical protein
MPYIEGFFWGTLGGLLAEISLWFKIRTLAKDDRPEYLKSWTYWIPTVLIFFSGGVLVIAHMRSGEMPTALTAINLGASAPLIIAAFAKGASKIEPGSSD